MIKSQSGLAFALFIAVRNEPGPLSFTLVTKRLLAFDFPKRRSVKRIVSKVGFMVKMVLMIHIQRYEQI